MISKSKIGRLSLRIRIFLAMVTLTLISSVLMAAISLIQFQEEAKQYQEERLERKESSIKEHISYILDNTTYPLTTENLPLIFREKIYELADIHNMEINIFDLEGRLLRTSRGGFRTDSAEPMVPKHILNLIRSNSEKRYVDFKKEGDSRLRSSYSELRDSKFKPIGILNLPYEEDKSHYEREVNNFFVGLGQVYFFMILFAFGMAYFLSSYITQTIKSISDKINETRLNKRNEKIEIQSKSQEINLLINAYNAMVDELEASAAKLARTEREEAWREMAKQVAHEIKNPLTPMRLTVQNFQRKFDPDDPDIRQKLNDYTQTLLQQIDTMSTIAGAFSSFASMPAQQNETLNAVEVIQFALDIFNEPYIRFHPEQDSIMVHIDRTQLIRIITNLVKNAIQAISKNQTDPSISVHVWKEESTFYITVKDNGAGISEENQTRIFEPKFTTKSSGMGLGLGIIRNIIENYGGSITFETEEGKGTLFRVSLPVVI